MEWLIFEGFHAKGPNCSLIAVQVAVASCKLMYFVGSLGTYQSRGTSI